MSWRNAIQDMQFFFVFTSVPLLDAMALETCRPHALHCTLRGDDPSRTLPFFKKIECFVKKACRYEIAEIGGFFQNSII